MRIVDLWIPTFFLSVTGNPTNPLNLRRINLYLRMGGTSVLCRDPSLFSFRLLKAQGQCCLYLYSISNANKNNESRGNFSNCSTKFISSQMYSSFSHVLKILKVI